MRRLLKRMLKWQMSPSSLILHEAVLVLLTAASILLYANWNRIFGKDVWTVTQYGPREINSSFYTISNPKRGLIVVDGGWTEDAEYVREQIRRLGGRVDAWILTHPHQDHIGAFQEIWTKRGGIRIGDVYTVPMASVEDCAGVAPWDSMEAYEAFLTLDIPQLQTVQTGDTLTLCGLRFDILSAFDETVREKSKDYLNDGSMMFRVSGPEKTFLFCADVGKSMSGYLTEKYGDSLKSDYVQMGHHGNGGLKKAFYRKASPEAAFFDAPDWLMYDESGTYNTPEKIKLMEGLGSLILGFHTAPNSVTL